MIGIIDYGMGNVRSIEKVLIKLGAKFIISNKIEDLELASHFILPGVGFFKEGITRLKNLGLTDFLRQEILIKKKPILGICLGMQLLFDNSEEGGFVEGLGFIKGSVRRFLFETNKLKIPHVGWNSVSGGDFFKIKILEGIEEGSNFYFVHSYYPHPNEQILCSFTDYGTIFSSIIQKENIFATQFHPEKSQKKGLQLLKNFINLKC
jgi:glutamine amidotransferase